MFISGFSGSLFISFDLEFVTSLTAFFSLSYRLIGSLVVYSRTKEAFFLYWLRSDSKSSLDIGSNTFADYTLYIVPVAGS